MAQASVVALRLYGVAAVESGQATSLVDGTSLVHFRALAAIVEPAHYSASALSEDDTHRYLHVLEQAHENAAVLPAPPGTVFQSQGTLMRWLELHYFTLTEALAVIEGHAAARVSITAREGERDGDAERSFAALAAESLRNLRSQAAATVTLPRADGDDEDGVVARASFLVDSQRWQSFKETVNKEAERQSALDFRVTGPWPPYDFVRMQFGGRSMFCTDCGSWNRGEASRCVRCGIRMPEGGDRRQSPPDPSVTALRQVTGGRYTIMHRVGEGGMASVYFALNVALDSPVVIKVLHPHLARESEMRERFKREAESAAQLMHPHICKIIDFGMVDDHVYLVMPFMARGTLSDRIGGHRSLTAETTAAIAAQVATGLDYAHRRGLVHRDIKPDNILFDEDENALVTDFGIATGHFRSRMTGSGNVMGTPHYMSPEQARGKLLDGRSDLYGLGVVMYETLLGFPPFDGADSYSISYKHVTETAVAPDVVDSRIPAQMSQIVMKCLEKNPANRFERGNALADALISFLSTIGAHNEFRMARTARSTPAVAAG